MTKPIAVEQDIPTIPAPDAPFKRPPESQEGTETPEIPPYTNCKHVLIPGIRKGPFAEEPLPDTTFEVTAVAMDTPLTPPCRQEINAKEPAQPNTRSVV